MSQRTKIIFIIAGILLAYGYLCRLINIFFFWESQTIGWLLAFLALMSYFFDLIKIRKEKNQKTTWLRVGIGFIIFTFIVLIIAVTAIKNTEPYRVATEYIRSDPTIQNELGGVKGFGLIPTGSASIRTNRGESSGEAGFRITVIGRLKNKDVTIYLEKTPQTDWIVTAIE